MKIFSVICGTERDSVVLIINNGADGTSNIRTARLSMQHAPDITPSAGPTYCMPVRPDDASAIHAPQTELPAGPTFIIRSGPEPRRSPALFSTSDGIRESLKRLGAPRMMGS